MNANVTIDTIMDTQAITLRPQLSIASAIDLLLENHITAAPVCNQNNELIGIFSVHDVMVNLWCQDYLPVPSQTVADLMSEEVIALHADEHLIDVTEYFCIDKEQLYPATNMGIATQLTTLSTEERARQIKVHKPQLLPVTNGGKFVGLLSRLHVLKALRPIYGPVSTEIMIDDYRNTQRQA